MSNQNTTDRIHLTISSIIWEKNMLELANSKGEKFYYKLAPQIKTRDQFTVGQKAIWQNNQMIFN